LEIERGKRKSKKGGFLGHLPMVDEHYGRDEERGKRGKLRAAKNTKPD